MIAFHRVLIAIAIAFCAGMTLWALSEWRSGAAGAAGAAGGDARNGALALAVGFAIAGVALAYYLRNLRRFLHR
jgi:hypothetical protein